MINAYEERLTGGHPNSLGNTIEVVADVLKKQSSFDDLLACYDSSDEVVRLRVSNAVKRVYKEKPEWVEARIDIFLNKISKINQPSTWWTMTQLFSWMSDAMSESQLSQAKEIVKGYLKNTNDWIVENTTLEALATWSKDDEKLHVWLEPYLEKYMGSSRKSVANRAKKLYQKYYT